LAGAVGAEQRDRRAVLGAPTDVIEGERAAEALAQVLDLERGRHAAPLPNRSRKGKVRHPPGTRLGEVLHVVADHHVADASIELLAFLEGHAGGRDRFAEHDAHPTARADHGTTARQELARAADAHRYDGQPGPQRQADAALLELAD